MIFRLLSVALIHAICLGFLFLSNVRADITASFNSASDVGVVSAGYTASGTASFSLNFSPLPGTDLMVVKNTELGFISGRFDNLAQGQDLVLTYGGINYSFVANYYDGTGNDLVLVWKFKKPQSLINNNSGPVLATTTGALSGKTVLSMATGGSHFLALCSDGTIAAWGSNSHGQLGNGNTLVSSEPVAVTSTGVLSGKTIVAVAAGYLHSLALCSDGTVAAWGIANALGNNSSGTYAVAEPVAVTSSGALSGKTVVSVSAGDTFSLALCSDGTLAAWGLSSYGQLGNNSYSSSGVPVAVTTTDALAGKTVVSISAGQYHSMALCSDGSVSTWGRNISGQLGNNTKINSTVPVAVVNTGDLSGKTVVAVAAGELHSLALCSDGTVFSWGNNNSGQLGNGSKISSSVPVAVTTAGVLSGKTVVAINAGNARSLALSSDGEAYMWGGGVSEVPVAVSSISKLSSERFVKLSVGSLGSFSFVLLAGPPIPQIDAPTIDTKSPTSSTFGANVTSDFGNAIIERGIVYAPTAINGNPTLGGTGVTKLSIGGSLGNFNAEVSGLSPGNLYSISAYASNAAGTGYSKPVSFIPSLGSVEKTFGDASDVAVTVQINDPVLIEGSAAFTLNFSPLPGTELVVVKNTGLGFITGRYSNLAQGQEVILDFGGINYTFVAHYYGGTGNDLVLVWKNSRPISWGWNSAGQLGNGSFVNSSVPLAVVNSGVLAGKTIVAFASGYRHTLALCSDGTVAAWGDNEYGQLGNSSTTDSSVPVAVTTSGALAGKTVVAISAGYYHSLALCSDGTVTTWGRNDYGQLGNNSIPASFVPVTLANLGVLAGKTVVAIAAGSLHNLALCSDRTVASWGRNDYGQLGNNSTTDSTVPVAVLAGKTVAAIAAGSSHSFALHSDGTLAGWGRNDYGQIGNDSTSNSLVPAAVATGTNTGTTALYLKTVVAIAVGYDHTIALCSDGTVATWGSNYYGQLGNNSSTASLTPVAITTSGVLSGKTVVAISAGFTHSLALCSDGSVASWGYGLNGQLGNNSTVSSPVPVAINNSTLTVGERFNKITSSARASLSLSLAAAPLTPALSLFPKTSNISSTGATLGGNVTSDNGNAITERGFVYAPTATNSNPALGGTGVTKLTVMGSTGEFTAVVAGLSPGTSYSFKAYAVNAAGTAYSQAGILATLGPAPVIASPPTVSAISALGVTFRGEVISDGGSTISERGVVLAPTATNTNPVLGGVAVTKLTAGNGTGIFTVEATGLIPGTSYSFKAFATNAAGTTYSSLSTFTPSVQSLSKVFGASSEVGISLVSSTPVQISGTASLSLNFAPQPGTELMVIKNTGLGFISGRFDNLAHGKDVILSYGGVNYSFVANYYGGSGNDLVLAWKNIHPLAWGLNFDGQLGNNSTYNSSLPVVVTKPDVLSGKTMVGLATGYSHSLGLCSDGTVVAWGRNQNGQLGNNFPADSFVPVAVNNTGVLSGKTVVAIAAGFSHNLALCSDGTIAAWGLNNRGQLGNNSTVDSPVPITVAANGALTGKTVVSVAAGSQHSLALCSDGTIAAWGGNDFGQLGDNSTAGSSVPVAVTTTGVLSGKTVVTISAGSFHSLALCADGTVATWGFNESGQLGNNSTISSALPVAITNNGVLSGKTVVAIAAGFAHSLALKSDGTVACWGLNSSGQLGVGSTTNRSLPVSVDVSGALKNKTVVSVAAGYNHALVICSDGTLISWGNNDYGQLGNGTTTYSSRPLVVSSSGLATGERFAKMVVGARSYHSLSLVAEPPAPALSLLPTSANISNISATLGGSVRGDGGSPVIKRGVIYAATSINSDPVLGGTGVAKSSSSGTTGDFAVDVSGLLPGVVYSFKAYATNAAGTAYSQAGTFTTLGPAPALAPPPTVTNISSLSATLGSDVMSIGASPVTERGLIYAASSANVNPMLGGAGVTKLTVSGDTGIFTVVASGLSPSTSYSFKAYATNANGTSYTQVGTFTTLGQYPVFSSGILPRVDNITPLGATLGGDVLKEGASSIIERGFVYAPSTVNDNPFLGGIGVTKITVSGTVGVFSNEVIGLSPGTNYRFKAYATNAAGTTYGSSRTFITLGPTPHLELISTADNLSATSASLRGGVISDGGFPITERGFIYAPSARNGDPLLGGTGVSIFSIAGGTDSFSSMVTGLLPGTSYSFKAYSTNAAGTTYSQVGTFTTTGPAPVLVSTPTANDFTTSSVTLGGEVIWDNGSTVTERGIVHAPTATNSNPVLGGLGVTKLSVSGTTGVFTAEVTGLMRDTSYSFKAFATNAAGTTYTNFATFTPLIQDLTKTFGASSEVGISVFSSKPVSISGTASLSLNFVPQPGTELVVTKNTGLGFISGRFENLAQGQDVTLVYDGITYSFVANYYGGSGNDLVLVWKNRRPFAWGDNSSGQIGDGSTAARSVPINVNTTGYLSGKTVVAVAAGTIHSLALCSDGTVAAWGNNSNGQLGDGSNTASSVPVAVHTAGVLSGKTVVAVAAGYNTSSALCSDGSVVAWGRNDYGQLGNNSLVDRAVPVAVTSTGALSGKTFVAISVGYRHSLALCSDGTIAAWGANFSGQLGNGSTDNSPVPVVVSPSGVLAGRAIVAISAGVSHNLALCSDGTIATWGDNSYGQLGNNSTTNSPVPVEVSGSIPVFSKTPVAIFAGGAHSHALYSDGTVASWGSNSYGELGDSSTSNSSAPVAVRISGPVSGNHPVLISGGYSHSLALCSDGTVAVWGSNSKGQLGNNSASDRPVPVAVSTSGLTTGERFTRIASGSSAYHSLALVASSLAPVVSTPTLDKINSGWVTFGGNVTSDNGNPITERGFVYALSAVNSNPTLNGAGVSKLIAGGTTGVFTLNVTGLITETSYSFRAYATNAAGTTYSSVPSFLTPPLSDTLADYLAAAGIPVAQRGPDADPDGDGLTNLLEYALGLAPNTSSNNGLPDTVFESGNLSLTYRQAVGDVSYVVEVSSLPFDTTGWTKVGVNQGTPDISGVTKATIPATGSSRFLRLRVTR